MNAPFAIPGTPLDPADPINRGLVGFWPMWEGAGGKILDISGKNNHGTLTNGPVWRGDGLLFDGVDDYVNCGNSSILKPSLPISVFAQITIYSFAAFTTLFGNDDVTNHAGIIYQISTTGEILINCGDNTGATSGNRRGKTSAAGVIVAGKEYTVAGVVRGTTDMSLYVNGADVGGTYNGTGGAMAYSTGNVTVGKRTTQYQNGGIKQIRMWNRGLSAAEVQRLSANPNIGLWVPDTLRYYIPAAGGADVRRKIIQAYMGIAA